MTEYRIKGEYGNEDLTVFTEWFDVPMAEANGIMLGLGISGWRECELEEREP